MRQLGKGLVFASVLILSGFAGTAGALPDNEKYTVYFYDAARTQYAGTRIFTCGRGSYADGVITSNRLALIDSPCGSPSGSGLCAAWDNFHSYFEDTPTHGMSCPFGD